MIPSQSAIGNDYRSDKHSRIIKKIECHIRSQRIEACFDRYFLDPEIAQFTNGSDPCRQLSSGLGRRYGGSTGHPAGRSVARRSR